MALPPPVAVWPAEPPTTLPSSADLRATAAYIASCQETSGAIPWEPAAHTDVWDHLECAMALNAAGQHAPADAAYEWMRRTQRPDGTWPMRQTRGIVQDPGADANQCAYLAVGIWHHWLVRADRSFVERMWPAVRAALDFAVTLQQPSGGIAWARGESGGVWPSIPLTGSSSVWHALTSGLRLAGLLGKDASAWELARDLLGRAIREHKELFDENASYSMDWYYPVLGGVIRGPVAWARIERRWAEFVIPGLGVRCVDHRPWVTGAETCELAIALEALGDKAGARRLVLDMQHLRAADGSYHTGYVYADGLHWPVERSTWTAAAVILAVDAIEDRTPGPGAFRC